VQHRHCHCHTPSSYSYLVHYVDVERRMKISSRQIDESISISRRIDESISIFYCRYLPADAPAPSSPSGRTGPHPLVPPHTFPAHMPMDNEHQSLTMVPAAAVARRGVAIWRRAKKNSDGVVSDRVSTATLEQYRASISIPCPRAKIGSSALSAKTLKHH
jgi:hypothetical protein